MEQQTVEPQKYFLIGIILLGALIIGGLAWAIVSGPSSGSVGTVNTNVKFNDANDPAIGPTSTKAVVRMFGDFQCPACGAAEEGVQYARQAYGAKVRFIWNDFPLTQIHSNAFAGSVAARCAEDQGKFWEYHDALYHYQLAWSSLADPSASFKDYAKELNLNADSFASCLSSQTDRSKIQDDMSEGDANGVDSTPTFFVNDKKLVGVLTKEDWDRELKPLVTP